MPAARASRSPLIVIFTTVFLDLIGFGMIVPLISLYGRHFGASGLELGILGASFSLMQFLFAPIWGAVSDRVGRRPVILIGLCGSTLSYVGFALAESYGMLLTTRIFAGVFAATISAAQAYIADTTAPEDRARGMGLIGAAFGLGFMLGPPLGGIAAVKIGLPAPGWIAASLCGMNALLALVRLPESLEPRFRKRAPIANYLPFSRERFRAVRRHPYLWILLAQFFLVVFAFSNLEQTFSLLFQEKFGFETGDAGYRTGLILMFASAVGALIQGKLIRGWVARFGEFNLLVAGFFFNWVGMMLFPAGPTFASYYLLMLPITIGQALINPTLNSLISKSAGPQEQGLVLGMSQGVGSLARAVGPFAGLSAFALFYGLPSAIGATSMFVVILLGFWLGKRAPSVSKTR